tara:strand:- start:1358 stop:1702 length:345 start_codon:yes stop_codon:yes gene_type:complete
MNKERKNMNYETALDNLMDGIKQDYSKWMSSPDMIERFNSTLTLVTNGRKYDKIMTGSSVWGFIAKTDGILKGIPYQKGDVFKAASWRGPAKHQRGNIFNGNNGYYQWTGPKYL